MVNFPTSNNNVTINSSIQDDRIRRINTITPAENLFRRSMTFNRNATQIGSNNMEFKKSQSFIKLDLASLFNSNDYKKQMSKIYNGFNPDLNFPRVLIITHGGYIMELLNSIRRRRNIRIKFLNNSKSTGLYVIKIYCPSCGGVCYNQSNKCNGELEYDVIIFNDTKHLDYE